MTSSDCGKMNYFVSSTTGRNINNRGTNITIQYYLATIKPKWLCWFLYDTDFRNSSLTRNNLLQWNHNQNNNEGSGSDSACSVSPHTILSSALTSYCWVCCAGLNLCETHVDFVRICTDIELQLSDINVWHYWDGLEPSTSSEG